MSALGDAFLEVLPLLVTVGLFHDVIDGARRISFESAFSILTSTMQSVPASQNPRMLMLPRLALGVGGSASGGDWVCVCVVVLLVCLVLWDSVLVSLIGCSVKWG